MGYYLALLLLGDNPDEVVLEFYCFPRHHRVFPSGLNPSLTTSSALSGVLGLDAGSISMLPSFTWKSDARLQLSSS